LVTLVINYLLLQKLILNQLESNPDASTMDAEIHSISMFASILILLLVQIRHA
jgi:hypothetical protein